jgi:hypothetical protein
MEMLIPLGAIFGAILIGAISPGPSFVLVARTAIAVSRSAGMATAGGSPPTRGIFPFTVATGSRSSARYRSAPHPHSFPWCGVRGNGDDWLSPASGRWTGTKPRDG